MRGHRIKRSAGFAGVMLAAGLLLFGTWACGKKAPPVPPKRPPLTRPAALEGRMAESQVRLTWRRGEVRPAVTAYAVMRAQWPADQPPCKGCPLIFKEAGVVEVDPDVDEIEFTDLVQDGQVYSYQVVPIGSSGDRGPASNRIVLPPDKVEE